jgi:hypothetical protein
MAEFLCTAPNASFADIIIDAAPRRRSVPRVHRPSRTATYRVPNSCPILRATAVTYGDSGSAFSFACRAIRTADETGIPEAQIGHQPDRDRGVTLRDPDEKYAALKIVPSFASWE